MKFTIRDLFLVTLIVALAIGWWLDHRRDDLRDKQLQQERVELEWRVKALTEALDVKKYRVRFTENGLETDKKTFDPAMWGSEGISRPIRQPVKTIPRQGLGVGEY